MGKEKTVNCELEEQHANWFLTAQALRQKGQLQISPIMREEDVLRVRKYSLIHCGGRRGFTVKGKVFREPVQCGRSYRAYWPMETRSKCPYCGGYNKNPV